jgi:negative regulator of sigma E activity
VLVAGLVAGLLTASVPTTSAAALVDDPFEKARQAAAQVSFTGTLEVRWLDGATEHHEQLTVQSAEGSLLLKGLLKGGNQVMVSATSERLVQHPDGDWNLLWPPALDRVDGPDPGQKYQVSEHDGAPVAGRQTTVVDIRQGPLLREQVFLDQETDLLLERRQFDDRGTTTRAVGFTSLVIDPATAAPPSPTGSSDNAPEVMTPAGLSSSTMAPARLADGYARVGVFRRDGVVQVLYSDGIYELSVFERRGELDRHELGSAGGPVTVGTAAGWRYAWAGGQVVLWQAGPTVFTVVSDAPLDQVLTAARDLPVPAKRKPSAMERLRSVARTLIQPLE